MMFTQRASISAVCGYSSLSIMFLSAVSSIMPGRQRRHPGGHERRQVQPGLPVEQQLVGEQLVGHLLAQAMIEQAVQRQLCRRVAVVNRSGRLQWMPAVGPVS